ncbi:MAG: hypothetical protein NWF05_11475 [Candidatus Bathyarchaeota archaeon]|nr:hypothetical protein [Candidatus Bathyarchaeota archaeon]
MKNPKTNMLIASIIGAAIGVYYTTMLNPLNNYYMFVMLFALIGICLANVALLMLRSIYEWFEQRYPTTN